MTNKEKLGKLGEDLFVQHFGGTLSENKYDSIKDLILDGKTVEVKTQNRHPNGSFTINAEHTTNMNKCLKVDRLIFVEYDQTDSIKIYECTDRQNYSMVQTRPTFKEPMGRVMVCWPISKMKQLATINDADLASQMRTLSGSRLFNANSRYQPSNFV